MRDFSKVAPSIWRSKKFRALKSDDARMIYFYLLTCPHGNSAGCFDMLEGYACADMGMVSQRYQDGLQSLVEVGLIEFDQTENTVLITNWLEFNAPANPKHAIGILSQLGQASSEALKTKRFQELNALVQAKKFDREQSVRAAFGVFLDCIETVSPPRPDRDQTKTETGDQTETKTRPDLDLRENLRPALRAPATLTGGTLAPVGGKTTTPNPADELQAMYDQIATENAKPTKPPQSSAHLLQTPLMRRVAG